MGAARGAVGQGRAHETELPDVETAGDAYAGRFAGPVGEWMLAVQAARALELLGAAAGDPLFVLDLGGGHGQIAPALAAAGHRVVVHGSRLVCHQRLRERRAFAHVVSRLWTLPFADRSFDLVVGIRLLAHVLRWRELLAEMARVSRRLVLVDFPARGALHRLAPRLFGAKQRLEGNTRPYFDYEPAEIEAALRAAGLVPAGVARQFALPMVLHRSARRPALSRALERGAAALGLTARAGSPILFLARRDGR